MLPLFRAIPPNAIYPVLVCVGVLMFSEVAKINFKDDAFAVATFFIVFLMPFTYSITTGLAFGFIAYLLVRLAKREFDKITLGVIILSIISVLSFLVRFL